MKIRTEFVNPPIPIRTSDWSAVDDETYDGPECPIGRGETEAEAIADLKCHVSSRAIDRLLELTKRWTAYEDVPLSQQKECRTIGRTLHECGGTNEMRDAYYEATGRNHAASVLAAYWDGIGDWQW